MKETNTSQCRPSEYWTALLLRPETFNRYRRRSFKVTEPSVAGKNMPADIVNDILDLVFLKWQEIAARLDLLNDDKHLLLDREAHDRLLFDDDSFSRSRKYFWMINFLAECNSLISETIEEAKLYMQEWPRELDLGVDWDGGDCLHKEALSLVDQLSLVKYNLNEMRAGVIAIRDGVCLTPFLQINQFRLTLASFSVRAALSKVALPQDLEVGHLLLASTAFRTQMKCWLLLFAPGKADSIPKHNTESPTIHF